MVLEIRTISDRLVDIVRDRILSGEIPPNVPIRQDSLAAELQISKIPLREALARLEQDGLLVSHPNRGFFVRPMSAKEAEEVYALRLKIEPDAAASACKVATDAEQQAAQDALNRLAVAAAAHEPSVGALNRAFHLALIRPGEQTVSANVVRGLHIIADRYVRKHLEPRYRHVKAESEHQEILDAWLDRDSRKVKKLLHAHLQHTLTDLRVQLCDEERNSDDGKAAVAQNPAQPGRKKKSSAKRQ
ncbi:MAG: GntR family transcriptional regulator [Woeseiaceae bacterium]